MERSSAEHAPSCSEPETMATAQRHHLYVSLGWICTVGALIVGADAQLHHTHTRRQPGVNLRNFKHTVGFRLDSDSAD